MPTGLRPYVAAGLVLTTAGVIAVTPITPRLPEVPVASPATRLLSGGDDLLNIGLNLMQDLFNVPYNEVQGMTTLAESLLFSGPWWVGSPTNVWGEDPGDPGHFEGLTEMYVPFPALSGAGHETDLNYPGLGELLAGLAAVEIPANPTCESLDCVPFIPTTPITGLTSFDQSVWSLLVATFAQQFPLIDNWFRVPFSAITEGQGYYFDPTAPGSIDSGVANPGFLWEGTHPGVVNGEEVNLMPWAGTYFKLDFAAPFQNFFNSLEQPFDVNNFQLADPGEIVRALQALYAGLVMVLDVFVPGSPLCPGPCLFPDGSAGLEPSYYLLAQAIGNLWPGNPVINQWLADFQDGTANVSTPDIINFESEAWRLQQTLSDLGNLGNPLPPDPVIDTTGSLPTLDQIHELLGNYLFNIADNSGILGPFDITGLWDAIFNVPEPSGAADLGTTAADSTIATDFGDLSTILDPAYWLTGPLAPLFF